MHFEIYTGNGGLRRWRLRAGNGEIVASGQGYKNNADAERAIDIVKSATSDTRVQELPEDVDEVVVPTPNPTPGSMEQRLQVEEAATMKEKKAIPPMEKRVAALEKQTKANTTAVKKR